MSILVCTSCDRPFDTDEQVEAEYMPLPRCEECVYGDNEQFQAWAAAIDADEYFIEEMCRG